MKTERVKSQEFTKPERINTIGQYLEKRFGCKVVKLSLDGNFTCPNRDGSKGTGGCIFCSADGSGDFAGSIPSQIALLSPKWPHAKYIAYFQNHTNTYAPASDLREKFTAALYYGKDRNAEHGSCALGDAEKNKQKESSLKEAEQKTSHLLSHPPLTASAPVTPEIIGLAIATRPDCLDDEIYELLSELSKKTFLWVELGLQSIHEETGRTINRCHSLAVYDEAVERLAKLGIRTVTHLIFGLPKRIEKCGTDSSIVIPETREEMLASVRHVCRRLPLNPETGSSHLFGIKLHMLNIVRGSQMEFLCPDYVPFSTIDEYTDLIVDALRIIPKDITIHRMSADAPRPLLIAPQWSYQKRTILNTIHQKMNTRGFYQGQDAD